MRHARNLFLSLLVWLTLASPVRPVGAQRGAAARPAAAAALLPLRGVDASFLPAIEAHGGAYFTASGAPADALQIFAGYGANLLRLRLWHTPAGEHAGLAHSLALAQRAHALGMRLLLDFHYSDTWADPGHQTKPAAWQGLSFAELQVAVHAYTRDVLLAFKQQGTLPEIVQLGNEITSGILWDDGRVGGAYDDNWEQLIALLNAAASGVRAALAPGEQVLIMLHLDSGGNNATCRWFLDQIVAAEFPFDLIGLSYYPWWHGDLAGLSANLADLATRYAKPLVIVETGYPWTLAWNDDTHNLVGVPEQLLPGYPATPSGQADFLAALRAVVAAVPGGLGAGVLYWSPEAISAPGYGSAWENVATFDFDGYPLPAARLLGQPLHAVYLPALAGMPANWFARR